jgi:protoporphyrin/coproporphyrin ferrochelatase
MPTGKTGVLLMAHGTPSSLDDMPEYLRLVRGGRPPSDELIAEMRHNYQAIGGRSPLTEITLAQADALAKRLGPSIPVRAGMRNWKPFIREAVAALEAESANRIIGIPLAPQFSTLSVKKYLDTARDALPAAMRFEPVESFHLHPLLVAAFAERLDAARPEPDERIVFTAHSLPVKVIESGDRYAEQVAETARAVAERSGVRQYECAFQSAGRTPEPWIGPDVGELIGELARGGVRRFLVVPIGFVCDHTEILFDIDIQAAATARRLGCSLRRTESLNTSATFISALEEIVRGKV